MMLMTRVLTTNYGFSQVATSHLDQILLAPIHPTGGQLEIQLGKVHLESILALRTTSSQGPSYASPKLRPSH